MDSKAIWNFATRELPAIVTRLINKSGLCLEQIDLVVPHQSNLRIIEHAAQTLGLPRSKFIVNIERFGNTIAASVAIALSEAIHQTAVRPNQNIILAGFGAGLTSAGILLRT
jgi:3-oxoacyl-[acyl-carrier-protein] synthase III